MSEIGLVLSEKFSADDAVSIRAALSRHLQVSKPVSVRQRSIDPPSFIQLLGAAAAWQILVKPAAAFAKGFFSTLGKKTAEAAWDGAAEWKKSEDLKTIWNDRLAIVRSSCASTRQGGRGRLRFAG